MKLFYGNLSLLALCFFHGSHVWEASAFPVNKSPSKASWAGVLRSTSSSDQAADLSTGSLGAAPSSASAAMLAKAFPPDMQLLKIQGGTLRTFKMPPETERAQVFLKTDGRPMKAKVEQWVGPLRTTHTMNIDNQDGSESPYRAIIKFKKGDPTLRITTTGSEEFPVYVGVRVPTTAEAKELAKFTENLWEQSTKTKIQGGSVSGGVSSVLLLCLAFSFSPPVSLQLIR